MWTYGKATGVYGNTEVTKPSLSKMQKWKRAALTLPQKNTKIKAFKFHIDLKLMNTWKLETRLSSKFSKRRIIGPTRALKFSKRYNIQYFWIVFFLYKFLHKFLYWVLYISFVCTKLSTRLERCGSVWTSEKKAMISGTTSESRERNAEKGVQWERKGVKWERK